MELINALVESYAVAGSSEEDPLLSEISETTRRTHAHSHMLSGHLQGKVLEMISWMVRPRRILEIGTFTGYSALCLASGLTDDGLLHTIEIREEDARTARSYFDRSPVGSRIISHVGNALSVLNQLQETWDLVFIDADKTGYIDYFNLVFPHVRKNGFILADNVFFHGEALSEEPRGRNARAIRAFNEFITRKKEIEKVILTLRDGLCIVRKR